MDLHHYFERFLYKDYNSIMFFLGSIFCFFPISSIFLMILFNFIYLYYKLSIKNIIWITDYDDKINDDFFISMLLGLHKYHVINLGGIIVNNDNLKVKSLLIRKKIRSYLIKDSDIPIGICGNAIYGNDNIDNNIYILEGGYIISDFITSKCFPDYITSKISIICDGKLTSLANILKDNFYIKKYIDNLILLGDCDIRHNRLIPNSNCKIFRDDLESAKFVFDTLQNSTNFTIINRNACNKISLNKIDILYEKLEIPEGTFIYKPLLLISLTKSHLLESTNFKNHKLIGHNSKSKFKYLELIKSYLFYWLYK